MEISAICASQTSCFHTTTWYVLFWEMMFLPALDCSQLLFQEER